MSSAKNGLQERYQGLSKSGNIVYLPKYNSERCGGDDHIPIWISTVTLHGGRTYKGKTCTSRKKAEISSAGVALIALAKAKKKKNKVTLHTPRRFLKNEERILQHDVDIPQYNEGYVFPQSVPLVRDIETPPNTKTKKVVLSNTNNRYLVLVDVENQQKAVDYFIKNYKKDDVDLVAFLSIGHHLKYKIDTKDSRIKMIEVPSTRKNSADVGLIVYLTHFLTLHKNQYKKIILVSSDHFIAPLADILNNSSKMNLVLEVEGNVIPTRTMMECISALQ